MRQLGGRDVMSLHRADGVAQPAPTPVLPFNYPPTQPVGGGGARG